MSGPAVIDAAFLEAQREFSLRTYGPGLRTEGVLDHIAKESREIRQEPTSLEEWVDVVILALDGAQRLGTPVQEIIDAVHAKAARNRERRWPDWRTAEPGKAIEHVREEGCIPLPCNCPGHTMPGVHHLVACCDRPHVREGA